MDEFCDALNFCLDACYRSGENQPAYFDEYWLENLIATSCEKFTLSQEERLLLEKALFDFRKFELQNHESNAHTNQQ